MQRANPPAGSIYDLGYRPYEGQRAGRVYAIRSLYFYTLRGIFGLGRSTLAKVFPWLLVAVAALPAALQIGVAAVAPQQVELVSHAGYFSYISNVVALFCAVTAPDVTGRDVRTRTLTLYFSRALARGDYVTAKLAAVVTSLFLLVFIPQTVLFFGNAVATEQVSNYIGDHATDFFPILASAIGIAVVMGGVSLALASQSPRRAISTIAVLGYFLVSFAVANVLVDTIAASSRGYSLLISPMVTLEGFTHWIFNDKLDVDSSLAKADLNGIIYLVGCVVYATVAAAWLYRRYQKMSV